MQIRRNLFLCTAAACLLVSSAAAHAQYAQLARGLYLLGFTPDVSKNRLTGGYDFNYTRYFSDYSTVGNTLNYGTTSLTLNGGLLFEGGYGKRPIPTGSFGMKTASSTDSDASDLSYTLTIQQGVETITVAGTVNINMKTTVDAGGFYNTVTSISNRATATGTGLKEFSEDLDFDVGPVNQTGNVYLQGLAGIVSSLSGSTDLTDSLTSLLASSSASTKSLDNLDLTDPDQLETYVNAVLMDSISKAATDPTATKAGPTVMNVIPEPSTLALLAMSVSFAYFGIRRKVG